MKRQSTAGVESGLTVKTPAERAATEGYLASRREWDERYGSLISRAKNWRAMSFLMALLCLILIVGLIYQSSRSHVVPYVIAVDKMGGIVGGGPAIEASAVDPQIVRTTLIQWLVNARTITSDVLAQKRYINQVYAGVGNQTAAFTRISDFYRNDSPFARGQQQTVSVDVHVVNPISPTTYEITWLETTRDHTGLELTKQEWKGVLTYVISPPKDESVIRTNPLGIYVTEFDWSKVL